MKSDLNMPRTTRNRRYIRLSRSCRQKSRAPTSTVDCSGSERRPYPDQSCCLSIGESCAQAALQLAAVEHLGYWLAFCDSRCLGHWLCAEHTCRLVSSLDQLPVARECHGPFHRTGPGSRVIEADHFLALRIELDIQHRRQRRCGGLRRRPRIRREYLRLCACQSGIAQGITQPIFIRCLTLLRPHVIERGDGHGINGCWRKK